MSNPVSVLNNTYAWASSASESDITLSTADASLSRIIVTNNTANLAIVTTGVSAATAALPTSATVPVACHPVPANQRLILNKPVGHTIVSIIQTAQDAGKYVYVTTCSSEIF
jgi:hypothetical protein